jgi:hypothetical protein
MTSPGQKLDAAPKEREETAGDQKNTTEKFLSVFAIEIAAEHEDGSTRIPIYPRY